MAAKTAVRVSQAEQYAAAIDAADELTQEVYRAQRERAAAGEIEYDPYRKARVVFRPADRGGYVAELHAVELDDIRKAQEEGADYWDPNRGWIRRGIKAELDPGTPIRRPTAASGGDVFTLDDPSGNEE